MQVGLYGTKRCSSLRSPYHHTIPFHNTGAQRCVRAATDLAREVKRNGAAGRKGGTLDIVENLAE